MKTNVGNHKNFVLSFLDVIFGVKFRSWILTFFSAKNTVFEIIEKVSFNIASEASYIYMSGEKFIKKAKNVQFWRVFENLKFEVKQCYQTGQY